jgi:hypothetical protein
MIIMSFVLKPLNDKNQKFNHFDELTGVIVELVKHIIANGAMLRSFSLFLIRIIKLPDGARTPPKYL